MGGRLLFVREGRGASCTVTCANRMRRANSVLADSSKRLPIPALSAPAIEIRRVKVNSSFPRYNCIRAALSETELRALSWTMPVSRRQCHEHRNMDRGLSVCAVDGILDSRIAERLPIFRQKRAPVSPLAHRLIIGSGPARRWPPASQSATTKDGLSRSLGSPFYFA